jgi:hypothetical protein
MVQMKVDTRELQRVGEWVEYWVVWRVGMLVDLMDEHLAERKETSSVA